MGTSELVEKILNDARARVAALQEEKNQRLAEIRGRVEALKAKLAAENETRIEQTRRAILERVRSQAALEAKKIILAARWEILDLVFNMAREKILSSPEYPSIIRSLVKKYASGEASVHLSPADTKKFGSKLGVKLGEPVAISGGLIVRRGREEVDLSLDAILTQVKEELITELARTLFSGS